MADDHRAVFFGLRTSVRYFASYRGFASLDTRLKTLALLYDDLVLEDGVYECTVAEAMFMESVSRCRDPSQLKPLRTRAGEPLVVKGARGGSDDFQTIIDTSIVKQFRSHFIRTFQDLASLNPRWVHSVYFDGDPRIDAQASTLADEWNAAEHEAVVQAMPTTPTFLRTRIHHNLNLDLARTAVLGTHLAPDGLHFPLLALKASGGEVKVGGSGQRPLLLAMPELSHASWEDVCDLRKWRGFQRLRAKMRELDGPELRDKDIQARLTAEYLAEVEKRRPRWAGTAVAGISFFLGFVPVLGQIVSGALAAQNAVTAARGSQHWTATLVRAKKRLAAPGTRLASS